MDLLSPAISGGTGPLRIRGPAPSDLSLPVPTVGTDGEFDRGNGVPKMTAVVPSSRSKPTWLTGVAGLLILAAAFVMMVCAAPKDPPIRTPLHGAATQSAASGLGGHARSVRHHAEP
jgi:hypothetical protein